MDDLLNTAPCGFIAFTDDGGITAVNHTLLELLGHPPIGLVGRKMEAVLTVASRIFYQTHFFPLLKLHGRAEEIFLSLRTDGGEDVPVLANAVRREREGSFLNQCVVIPVHRRKKYEDEILLARRAAEEALQGNDELIHAKRELERHARRLDQQISRLEQKNQELARVSHILSHDLREPVRKISWFAEALRDESPDALTPAGRQAIERISATCQTMDDLIHVLREFVSLDIAEEATEEVDLNEVVAEALRHVRDDTGAEDMRLESDALPTIEGFRRQLVLLFRNLIENAVRFRQADVAPTIHLSSLTIQHNSFRSLQGRYRYVDFAKIVFRDNSIGFDGKRSERIFDPLTNVRTRASGFGLGLATCRKVVDNHQGTISVVSEPGRGATYTILLPFEQ